MIYNKKFKKILSIVMIIVLIICLVSIIVSVSAAEIEGFPVEITKNKDSLILLPVHFNSIFTKIVSIFYH